MRMSLKTIGYLDGKPIRIDEGPSSVNWSGPLRGGRIEEQPGSFDRQRLAEYQRKHVAKKAAQA
jgi:hypothetical protein